MPLPENVEAIQPVLMREEVYLAIRRWIVDGSLAPGEKLRDAELADRLNVSRMPVREALNRLADEGFVETAANRWTRVTPIDPDDARRIYPIVWSLEPLALLLAGPRLEERHVDAMVRHNERLRVALNEGDAVEASHADDDFHQVYIEATTNPELIKILRGLKVKLRRLEVAYFGGTLVASRSALEHDELVAAIRVGEIGRAAELARSNWRQSFERVLNRVQPRPEPSPARPDCRRTSMRSNP